MTEPERARPRPRPRPRIETDPLVEPDPRPSRLDRRRGERRERRSRSRRWVGAVAALVAAGGVAVFTVAASGHDTRPRSDRTAAGGRSSPVAATEGGSPSPPSHVTGAYLTDPNLALSFLAGAASDLAAVTSYDYRHLDDALSVGLSVTTGPYQDAYRAALTGPVADEARSDHVVQTFQQLAAGIGEIDADGTHAKVLVFGEQTRTDDQHDGARTSTVTLTATIERSGSSYLISGLDTSGTNAGLPPGSEDLTFAAEAGRGEVVNTLSYRRAGFAADLQRALDGAIDPLRSQIARTAQDTKAALTAGHSDLSGTVTGVAIRSAQGTRVELLVAATGYQVAGDGTRTPDTDGRYEVSVVMEGGRWVTNSITPIAAS